MSDDGTAVEDAELIKCLLGIGCCPRCALRILGIREAAAYHSAESARGLSREAALCWGAGNGSHASGESPDHNNCCVCLGLLWCDMDPEQVAAISEGLLATDMEAHTFSISVTVPASVWVRQRGAWVHAAHTVGYDRVPRYDQVFDPKFAARVVLEPVIRNIIGSDRDDASGQKVHVTYDHADSVDECAAIIGGPGRNGPKRARPNEPEDAGLAKAVQRALLESGGTDKLDDHGMLPPERSGARCRVRASRSHTPLSLYGRYMKFARNVSQTPWYLEDTGKVVSSVQELIAGPVLAEFGGEGVKLHGAGREDVDVRMLGRGRPFVLEVANPARMRRVLRVGMRLPELQESINLSTGLVQVFDLSVAASSTMSRLIKPEDEGHRKIYRCIVWVSRAVTQAKLDEKISGAKEVVVAQKTPIRVLHRRSLLTRPRTVHSMHAELINAHTFILDLETQAGTYVKEFVHGDFGRTSPSIGSLLECEADILQLDVLDIVGHEDLGPRGF